ncbi:MAG TPA: A/G-specific adenine glycosylase [Tepidisphaeraceae bacterium]|nr:A/G-specific adenine glycosylase [Tepidisphaeraceae bacterium]
MSKNVSDFARRLLRWYDRSRRDLPWRTTAARPGPLDPYHVLVSETMLQQTQVATVVPYFHQFVGRFPTLADLAAADEQEVLRLWQGLGYYSRARNLQAAARKVVSDYGGKLPSTRDELLKLPGIGRYTAGAIASIAFGQRAPILDGNVMRVLCRIDKVASDPRDRDTQALLWARAEQLLPRRRVGDFNSALMELGATVCTPRNPQCLVCPVQQHCKAFEAGVQDRIPVPRKTRPTPLIRRRTYCISHEGHWLIEQRPAKGRWAGMWQFTTIDPGEADHHALLPVPVREARKIGVVSHALTHRRYEFEVYVGCARGPNALPKKSPMRWVSLEGLEAFPLPRPHVLIAQMLCQLGTRGSPHA